MTLLREKILEKYCLFTTEKERTRTHKSTIKQLNDCLHKLEDLGEELKNNVEKNKQLEHNLTKEKLKIKQIRTRKDRDKNNSNLKARYVFCFGYC